MSHPKEHPMNTHPEEPPLLDAVLAAAVAIVAIVLWSGVLNLFGK